MRIELIALDCRTVPKHVEFDARTMVRMSLPPLGTVSAFKFAYAARSMVVALETEVHLGLSGSG